MSEVGLILFSKHRGLTARERKRRGVPAFIRNPYRWFEYLLSVVLLYGGYNTIIQIPTAEVVPGVLGIIVSQVGLLLLGLAFIVPGLLLLYGLVREKPNVRAWTLTFIYLMMVFATILDIALVGFFAFAWIDSAIAGLLTGAAYLRLRWEQRHG